MGNKPPRRTLESWWENALLEGLNGSWKIKGKLNFELVYWAPYIHPVNLDPSITDPENPLYVEDPYIPADPSLEEEKPRELRVRIVRYLEKQLDKIFLNEDYSINFSSITDFIIHHFFSDLEVYYKAQCQENTDSKTSSRDAICSCLAATLKKHRKKRIMLIAHSMGSIIAYDVLTRRVPDISIDTLVTIGSPLGLPIIKSKIFAEQGDAEGQGQSLRTPENVRSHWYNLSDFNDKIALNYKLNDDFGENSRNVRVIDKTVINNYAIKGKKNPHKVYGYLRTSEMAEIVHSFIKSQGPSAVQWLKSIFNKPKWSPWRITK
jgi:hypothetical protein